MIGRFLFMQTHPRIVPLFRYVAMESTAEKLQKKIGRMQQTFSGELGWWEGVYGRQIQCIGRWEQTETREIESASSLMSVQIKGSDSFQLKIFDHHVPLPVILIATSITLVVDEELKTLWVVGCDINETSWKSMSNDQQAPFQVVRSKVLGHHQDWKADSATNLGGGF